MSDFEDDEFVDAATTGGLRKTSLKRMTTDMVLDELRGGRTILDENLTKLVRAKRDSQRDRYLHSKVDYLRNKITAVKSKEGFLDVVKETLGRNDGGSQVRGGSSLSGDISKNGSSLVVPWRWLERQIHGSSNSKKTFEITEMNEQTRKDIERDVLCINGVEISGTIGYDNIWIAIQTTINGLDPTLSDQEVKRLSEDILRFVSRTQSTGAAFESLNYLFGCPSVCMFSPESSLAPPLVIDIGVGRWGDDWGLGICIRAESIYKVIDPNFLDIAQKGEKEDDSAAAADEDGTFLRLKAVYEQAHSLKAIDGQQSRMFNAAQLRANIAFEKYEPPLEDIDDAPGPESDNDDEDNASANEDDDEQEANPLYRYAGLALADMTAGTMLDNVESQADHGQEMQDTLNEIYSFGRNESGMLGVPDTRGRLQPARINFSGVVELTRVSKISCSWYHTVALTDVGLLYSWGDGSDGALGHGSRENVLQPRLVEWFTEQTVNPSEIEDDEEEKLSEAMKKRGMDPILLIDVACGSDKIGAHTVACSTKGKMYSWGIAGATGHRITQSLVSPRLIDHPSVERTKIKQVAAGGSFSLALSVKGGVYSFGKWANGRLGHGYLPAAAVQTRRSLARRQVPRFLLFPKRIEHLKGTKIKYISAGEGHALCIDNDGVLYSWGVGRHGQLGLGETGDQLAPTPISEWHSNMYNAPPLRKDELKIKHASAGATHSLATTESGNVYAWGATGGACLGVPADHHADTAVVRSSGALVRASRVAEDRGEEESAAWLSEESTWLRPRLVTHFSTPSINVVEVSAGVQHSVATTSTGEAYIWGGGLDKKVDLFTGNIHTAPAQALGVLGNGKLRSMESCPRLIDVESEDGIVQRRVRTVACGGWHTIVVTQGMHLGDRLRVALKASTSAKARVGTYGSDVVINVVGRRFFVHKAVLASRSETFKKLIEAEEQAAVDAIRSEKEMAAALTEASETVPPTTKNDIGPIQLLMSEMQPNLVYRMIEFIYTDTVRGRLDPTSNEVKDLLVLAEEFKLPRLRSICESAMSGESGALQVAPGGEVTRVEPTIPSQLGHDFAKYVGNKRWADVCFLVEGKRVYAHAVILMTASKYFEGMLLPLFSPDEGDKPVDSQLDIKVKEKDPLIEIEVPDTYELFVMVLVFIYTGNVVPTEMIKEKEEDKLLPEALKAERGSGPVWDPIKVLGLLVAGKRYRLLRLVRICESLCKPDLGSCMTILSETHRLKVHGLMDETLSFVARSLDVLKDQPEFSRVTAGSPQILEPLLQRVQAINRAREWGVGRQAAARKMIEDGVMQELAQKKTDPEEAAFPWLALFMMVSACAGVYLFIIYLPEDYLWVTPFINIGLFGGAIVITGRVLAS